MDSEQVILIFTEVWPYNFDYHSKTFRRQVSFGSSWQLVSVKKELMQYFM